MTDKEYWQAIYEAEKARDRNTDKVTENPYKRASDADKLKADIDRLNTEYNRAWERLKSDCREIGELKAENKQLKTECALLDDELRIARQDTIDVLNELKTKAFDKDAFNGWAGSTFVVLVRDIDKMIEELTKCQK